MLHPPQVDVPSSLRELEMTIRILEEEQVEIISVPVPNFEDGDPADIVHDFDRVRLRPACSLVSGLRFTRESSKHPLKPLVSLFVPRR